MRAALDYRGSGFDRCHIASAADHKSSASAMNDTFFMSCPQFNRGYWAKLGKHVRAITKIYLPIEEGGKRFVKYEVTGLNDIAVTTHFFKVINS